jgi:hypothetical protein
MSPTDPVANKTWGMLEALYLESGGPVVNHEYSRSSENEKRAALIAFVNQQATRSARWSEIARDLRSIDRMENLSHNATRPPKGEQD